MVDKPTYTIIPTEKLAPLGPSKEEAEKALTMINTTIPGETLGGLSNYAHERVKEFDAVRSELKSPALEACRDIDGKFRPTIKAWKSVKDKAKLTIAEQQRIKKEVNDRAMAAHQAQQPAQIVEESYPSTVSVATGRPRVKLIDISLVPREYLAVDWSAVNIAVRNGVNEIPGLSIDRDNVMVRPKSNGAQ